MLKIPTKEAIKGLFISYKVYIVLLLGGLIIITALGWAILNPGRDYVTTMIQNFVKQQHDLIIQNDKNEMDALKTQVSEIRQQNNTINSQVSTMKKQIGALKHDIDNNKPPKTSQERTDRLNKLGLHPSN